MNSWSSVVAGLRQSHELEVLGYGEEETTSRGVMSDEEEREKGFRFVDIGLRFKWVGSWWVLEGYF